MKAIRWFLRSILYRRDCPVLLIVLVLSILVPLHLMLVQLKSAWNCKHSRPYYYSSILNGTVVNASRPIMVKSEWLAKIHFPSNSYLSLEGVTVQSLQYKLVFVTAASSNHFIESLDMVASVQKFFPEHDIYYFDLGLNEDQKIQLEEICQVIYRKFSFAAFPPHLRHLETCAWKPPIIQEILSEHQVVMWLDTSIRLWSDKVSKMLTTAIRNGGVSVTLSTHQPVWAATHRGTYKYLPADQNVLTRTEMYGGGHVLILNTREARENVVDWWILCSLDEHCIAPGYWLWCDRTRSKGKTPRPVVEFHEGCHRFDQSILNVLLVNWAQVTGAGYKSAESGWVSSQREQTHNFEVKNCPKS